MNNSEHQRWINDRGDHTHRLNYDLNENSIIFDVGGYKGLFSENLYKKYGSNIYIFEPVLGFFGEILKKFKDNPKIKCYNFGIGTLDESLYINVTENSSSVFGENDKKEKITIKSIDNFLKENNIEIIDLAEINIEGGEYDLLEGLIKSSNICKFKNLQVQFHRNVEGHTERRQKIRENLSKTHTLTYDYEFIWESWKLKNN